MENPNEGDPIRESIVEGNALYMTNNAAVKQSCFASNTAFLHRLLDCTTEKCISGIQFQRSDLMRMLSHSSFLRDNTIEMYRKVLTSLECTSNKVFFVAVPWFTCLSNPDFSKKIAPIHSILEYDWLQWKINLGNSHRVSVYYSPHDGDPLFYWDSLSTNAESAG